MSGGGGGASSNSSKKIHGFLSLFFSRWYTVKKVTIFPSPAGMSLTELSLAGNNLIIPAQGEFA
jgi:hypothetical protein